jgi:hypothetical protein
MTDISRLAGRLLMAGLSVAALGSPLVTGGCARSLFKDSPRARNPIPKYYGNDSAVEATENRRRMGQMGFGFPTGPN